MAGSLASEEGRCLKTRGRRWRCPMSAQPNRSFCSDHRTSILKKKPSSLQENPGRVLDHQASEPDNFGSCKKRSRRREMTISDPAVTTKRGNKKKKTDSDPLTLTCDLLRLALKREMKKVQEKIRNDKETHIIKLPNGTMTIPRPRQSKGSSSTVSAVEPEPGAVIKKLLKRPWGLKGLKKWTFLQKSDKPDTGRETATSISEELTNVQNRSSSICCTVYKISQLEPLLELFNWGELIELFIEAKSKGILFADVIVETIECSQDMQYKCRVCGGLIVSLFRVCSMCYHKHCLSCCQQIRRKDMPKEADIIEQNHDNHFPETVCKFCGDVVLRMNLLLPSGFLESVEGGSNSR